MMRTKGISFGQLTISSPIKSFFFSRGSLCSLSFFRSFGARSAARAKMKLGLGNIKGLDDALDVYENMSGMRPLPSAIQFNQLLSRVVKLKEYSAAIRFFKDICNLGISVDECSMNIAMNCYCLSDRVNFGFSILGCFFKRGCVPNIITFSTLLKGLFRENKINEAQGLFRKMVKEELCALDVVTYGIVIDGLCKAGNTPMAIEMLRVMEKERSRCKPDTHIYSMVIDGLCKDGMTDYALKLFDEMSEKGIAHNVVTYNALVYGLCNLSRWSEVKMLLKKMIDYKMYPDVFTFNALIDALCKDGLVDEAQDVIRIMKQQNVTPDVISYNSLMDGYCLQGRMDEARNVLDSSMACMNTAPDVRSYNILINGYCKKKKIDEAMHLLCEMPSKGVRPNIVTYTVLLDGLFCVAQCSVALKLFDELQTAGLKPDLYTYCNVLDGLCRNGQVKRAVLLLDALEHKKGGEHLHISYYNIIMSAFCAAQKFDAARAIFRCLSSKGLECNIVTYNIMIKVCCQDGKLEEAKDLLLEMERANLLPNEVTYNILVQKFLRIGEYGVVARFLEEMDAKEFPLDSSTFGLMIRLPDLKEKNPALFEIIQKWAPSQLRRRLMIVLYMERWEAVKTLAL